MREKGALDGYIKALEELLFECQVDRSSETSQAITAIADHVEVTMPLLDTAVMALLDLSEAWRRDAGLGDDDVAFPNVSGPGAPGDPMFPRNLAEMLRLHVEKNRSYVGDNPDPLANYVNAGTSIGVRGWQAGYMRMAEKMSRLQAGMRFTNATPMDGETVGETLTDIAVIALLVKSLYRQNR